MSHKSHFIDENIEAQRGQRNWLNDTAGELWSKNQSRGPNYLWVCEFSTFSSTAWKPEPRRHRRMRVSKTQDIKYNWKRQLGVVLEARAALLRQPWKFRVHRPLSGAWQGGGRCWWLSSCDERLPDHTGDLTTKLSDILLWARTLEMHRIDPVSNLTFSAQNTAQNTDGRRSQNCSSKTILSVTQSKAVSWGVGGDHTQGASRLSKDRGLVLTLFWGDC